MLLTLLTLITQVWASDSNLEIQGTLREKGTRNPLEGVSIFILPSKQKVITDKQGQFKFEKVSIGKFTWIINSPGYQKLELEDVADEKENTPRTVYLEKDSYQVYETTIHGRSTKKDNSLHVLKREEILKAPGSLGDPLRATQNLPGVNRPQALSSQVVIQGSGPNDTQYLLNGHHVPLVFHFGGLSSIMIPEAVDRVELMQAGYGPEWGRASGGLIGVWTRTPRKDRIHGLAYADILSAGALIDGPISDKSSFLLAARSSYIGPVLRAALKNNKDFNLTVAPEYSDLTALYEHELTSRDTLQITGFGSQDTLQFLLKEPLKQDPVLRGSFDSGTSFYRVIPQLTHRHSSQTTSRWSFGLGKDWIRLINNDTYFRLANTQLSSRGEVEHRFNDQWMSSLGFDNRSYWAKVSAKIPDFNNEGGVTNPLSTGSLRQTSTQSKGTLLGFYTRNDIALPNTRASVLPNLRFEYFDTTKEWLVSPRPAAKFQIDDSLLLRASGGLYYQPPQPQELDSVFGNPSLQSSRAWHTDFGIDKDFREGRKSGWTLSGDTFYKKLERLVIPSNSVTYTSSGIQPENYNNNGTGHVYGIQTQIKFDQQPWSLSTIYTLSRSRRSQPGKTDFPSQFDQTHLLGIIGSLQLPGNWVLSGRFRYATGNPSTPVVGSILDTDNDVYIPIRGQFYSERLPSFYQLDLRIDKKWIFNTWILSLYLDVINATNRKNQEGVVYSFNYGQKEYLTGLPILPTFGVKGEF